MIEIRTHENVVIDTSSERAASNESDNLYRREEAFIRYALDSAAIVAITDSKGTITYVNNKFCEISGYTRDELVGSNHRMVKSGHHDTDFFNGMYHQIGHGNIWHGEICNRSKSGNLYWVDTTIVPHRTQSGKIDSYTAIRFDITAQKNVEAQLRANRHHLFELANHDALTGLANRRRFQTYLADSLMNARLRGTNLSLALIDLDAFKEVNDSFGHDAGDSLLITIADTIKASLGPEPFIARLGGDEFGIIYLGVKHSEILKSLEIIRRQLRTIPTDTARSKLCSASIGVAFFPSDGEDTTTLFKAADIALYAAKARGRNRITEFKPALMEALDERVALLRNVSIGLTNKEFELYYQPIVPAKFDRKLAFEALLRWKKPDDKIWTPSQFSIAFEDAQTSALIGQYVLNRVFDDAMHLRKQGTDFDYIAINLTNADLMSDDYINLFIQLLRETKLPPDLFCVEVTERILLSSEEEGAYNQLKKLTDLGVRISFDDFGTGYGSLTHLRELPIHHIKIDRSFVENIQTSVIDQAIIEGIVNISHKMGKRVVVEGVETKEQLDVLRKLECDDIQGFLFSSPQPLPRLSRVIEGLLSR
ncbi:putative bifunctional diguanylate cyclase/phosphodiesterase [Ochrobactrum sp. S1502_03]|uniref:putative bifunctional diguanylate cyclase/phosphodiesterase n=1 Tax=Ochrobactrum sp. S1502_03 TaxID=3108451 RepID=UPI0037C89E0E